MEQLTKTELHLLRRAAGWGSVYPQDPKERQAMAQLVHRALLRRRFWYRGGAARLTRAGWAVIDTLDDDPWAN